MAAAQWRGESEEIVGKLEAIANSANFIDSQITQIHELSSTQYEAMATFQPGRMKILAAVVEGHQLALEKAKQNEALAEHHLSNEV